MNQNQYNTNKFSSNRIELLDGFRTVAIFLVMLFHFFTRWKIPYNKENIYNYSINIDFFRYGYLGVELFFIISGYVIVYTLYNTDNFILFWKKRLIRLVPTMFFCSLITLIIFSLFDNDSIFTSSHSIKNWLFSITLISPLIPNSYGLNLNYIDGSYWSLWVEIQFYLIASFLFFLNKSKFFFRFVALNFCGFFSLIVLYSNAGHSLMNYFFSDFFIIKIKLLYSIFNIFEYNLWFLFGVLFYKLHNDKFNLKIITLLIFMFAFQMHFYNNLNIYTLLFSISFIGMFLILIYKPYLLNFLKNKFVTNIGISSYSLYLIHQNIGVLLINKFSSYLKNFDFIFPFFVVIILTVFSYFSYKLFEKPVMNKLNKYFVLKH